MMATVASVDSLKTAYDNIGNRKSLAIDPPWPIYYCTNPLNQYVMTAGDESCNSPYTWFGHDADGTAQVWTTLSSRRCST